MVFSSTVFLFFFLPSVLLGYLLFGRRVRNLFLLAASLCFYTWGENVYVFLMLASICCNYVFGLLIERCHLRGNQGKAILILAIVANLGALGYFKYADFIIMNLNAVLQHFCGYSIALPKVHLPIGISFFTFQALSYVIDIYRNECRAQKNLINLALYIALFPQLIAGPIVRYLDIELQLAKRNTSFDDFFVGVERFIIGFSKKVLIANVLGRTADYLFSVPPSTLSTYQAWLGAVAYSLQIYYDFSGYSDMAVGLGKIFGFTFLENFNYPYIATSIRDFWKRWHISLSSWFRDYLYISMGGNRNGNLRTSLNLLVVFFLCGLWHGANWTFIVWGLFHGLFLVLERVRIFNNVVRVTPRFVKHLYVWFVFIIGWVFFRSESIEHAWAYIEVMLPSNTVDLFNSQIFVNINNEFYVILVFGLVFSTPIYKVVKTNILDGIKQQERGKGLLRSFWRLSYTISLGFMFLYSISNIMRGAYNPFLYFRF